MFPRSFWMITQTQTARIIRKWSKKSVNSLNFTSLQFHRLDDLIESIGLEPCKLCTYCWNGKE